jgi:hypothetical protein
MIEGSGAGSVSLANGSVDPDADPGGPKHMDPTDPDPKHYKKHNQHLICGLTLNELIQRLK